MKTDRAIVTRRAITGTLLALALLLFALMGGLFGCATSGSGGRTMEYNGSATLLVNNEELPLSGTSNTIADIVQEVADTVVEITTESVTTNSFMQQYVTTGAGSGVIIAGEGFIVTNNHVIEGANTIKVTLRNGDVYDAALVATDILTDVAVVKIDPDGAELKAATWYTNSDNLKVGQQVIAIGNPLGSLGGTVTEGIISALGREISVDGIKMTLLQTSAAINPGNSGGGLFDMNGRLVAIVNAKSSGTGIEGLGFAIPGGTAQSVASQLIESGKVAGRKNAGIEVEYVTNAASLSNYGLGAEGVYISAVPDGSNFKVWDYIYSVNGVEISSIGGYLSEINSLQVGETVTITVYRRTGVVSGFGGSRIQYKAYTLDAVVGIDE